MIKNNIHYNYIIAGKSNKCYTLLNEYIIHQIYIAFSSFVQFTDIKKVRISTLQYAKAEGDKYSKRVKIGRVKWDVSDLNTITTRYKSYPSGNFNFLLLKAEFPSIDSAYKRGTTPDIVLTVQNDKCWGKDYNTKECGLGLSVREDVYEKIGEETVHSFLRQVVSLLDESKVFFKKRAFLTSGIKEVSMLDILPNSPKEYFNGWTELSF